jgi:hypothetical protein
MTENTHTAVRILEKEFGKQNKNDCLLVLNKDGYMSKQEDRDKHSSRLHADDTAIRKQVKIAKAHGIEIKEPHKLVKHHALDCGVPNCPMCSSPRKTYKEPTIQEKSFDQTKAWVDEGESNDALDKMAKLSDQIGMDLYDEIDYIKKR